MKRILPCFIGLFLLAGLLTLGASKSTGSFGLGAFHPAPSSYVQEDSCCAPNDASSADAASLDCCCAPQSHAAGDSCGSSSSGSSSSCHCVSCPVPCGPGLVLFLQSGWLSLSPPSASDGFLSPSESSELLTHRPSVPPPRCEA